MTMAQVVTDILGVEPKAQMTADEARTLTNRIRETHELFTILVYEAHDRGAWRALGYASWRDYVDKELAASQSRAYQLVDQGRAESRLRAAAGVSNMLETRDAFHVTAREAATLRDPELLDEAAELVRTGTAPRAAVSTVIQRVRVADGFSDGGDGVERNQFGDGVERIRSAGVELRYPEDPAIRDAYRVWVSEVEFADHVSAFEGGWYARDAKDWGN